MIAGVRKRGASKLPTPSKQVMKEFRHFVRNWVRKNLVPLAPETDLSVEHWLERTSYPLWRKEELRKKWEAVTDPWDHRYRKVKCFQKDECYPEYKHGRAINSRTDEFKCLVGPWFKALEEVLYEHPAFIKHVPVAERGRYIKSELESVGAIYLATDFTSFEASFIWELMDCCEFELYRYMFSKIPGGSDFVVKLEEALGSENLCEFKNFIAWILATRMSGEMNTSLGNGFSNLMANLFTGHRLGWDVKIKVEGDDGIARWVRKRPNAVQPTDKDFALLGFNMKLEVHKALNEASFCGLVFDEDDAKVVTDPIETLVSFGWVSRQYARAKHSTLMKLLRCKALSLAHQYPGCPILHALSHYGMRVTRSYCVRDFVQTMRVNTWERDQLIAAIRDERSLIDKVVEPSIKTRLLVEKKYGVRVEHQLLIEDYLWSKNDLEPIDIPILDIYFKPHWVDFFYSYSMEGIIDEEPSQQWQLRFPKEWADPPERPKARPREMAWGN